VLRSPPSYSLAPLSLEEERPWSLTLLALHKLTLGCLESAVGGRVSQVRLQSSKPWTTSRVAPPRPSYIFDSRLFSNFGLSIFYFHNLLLVLCQILGTQRVTNMSYSWTGAPTEFNGTDPVTGGDPSKSSPPDVNVTSTIGGNRTDRLTCFWRDCSHRKPEPMVPVW
jgi:hypothetical protein